MRIKKSKLQKRIDDPCSRYWRNKADDLWRQMIFEIEGHKCAVCGATEHLNAHHLIPRTFLYFRHDLRNGILLCPSHHKYGNVLSAHKNPIRFVLWFMKNRPPQWSWLSEQFDPGTGPDFDTRTPPHDFRKAFEELKMKSYQNSLPGKAKGKKKNGVVPDGLGNSRVGVSDCGGGQEIHTQIESGCEDIFTSAFDQLLVPRRHSSKRKKGT
jgi:hypothetical protein